MSTKYNIIYRDTYICIIGSISKKRAENIPTEVIVLDDADDTKVLYERNEE